MITHIHSCEIQQIWSASASCIFQAVASVGANLCCLYNEAEEQEKFLSVITDAEWGIKLGKLEVCGWKLASYFIFTLDFSWLDVSPCFCHRYRSSRCSVSGLRWRVVWSLIWWKTGRSLQTLFFSTAGQLLIYRVKHFCFTVHHSLLPPVLKVTLCFHLQRLQPGPWRCDEPIHYHLTAAPRGRGRCRRPGHRPGRDAAFVSRRRTGASPADYPDITQHQWTHRKSLRCHIQGLCKKGDKPEDGDLLNTQAFFHEWNYEVVSVPLRARTKTVELRKTYNTSVIIYE